MNYGWTWEKAIATYDQYNKLSDLLPAVVSYHNNKPIACGCFKTTDGNMMEIKRRFVCKEQRGKGLSKKTLTELEQWAKEKNYRYAVLETSIHFSTARNLYTTNGCKVIPNYGPYANLPESICIKKELQ